MRSLALSVVVVASAAALAALTLGCQNRPDLAAWTRSAVAQQPAAPPPIVTAVPVYAPAPQAQGPVDEKLLDTQVTPPPAPPANAGAEAPVLVTKNRNKPVRTISDENLPTWVPVRGRLTVVSSSDLAENLGLVPVGTTKSTDERISVADKLAEEHSARTASAQTSRGGEFAFSSGRVRNHRF
jgi:hypothetical protein